MIHLRPAITWQLPVALLGVALGLLLTLQFKAQVAYKQSLLPSKRIEELTYAWRQVEKKRIAMEGEVTGARRKLQALGGAPAQTQANGSDQVTDSRLVAGFTAVSGPGIEVVLTDADDTPVSEFVTRRLNGDDLLKVVNELRVANAEAIALNGERLISQSEIVTAGNGIMVNQRRVSRPYHFKAIGEAAVLARALKAKGGILENLQFYGTRATITPKRIIRVPAYRGRIDLRYARPVIEGR
jgi:uncharacterized protein YlxW (UPF0749 family)